MEAEGEKEVTLQLDEPDFENNDAKLSRRSSVVSTGRSPRYEPSFFIDNNNVSSQAVFNRRSKSQFG